MGITRTITYISRLPVRKLTVFNADEHVREHTATEYLKIGVLGAPLVFG